MRSRHGVALAWEAADVRDLWPESNHGTRARECVRRGGSGESKRCQKERRLGEATRRWPPGRSPARRRTPLASTTGEL